MPRVESALHTCHGEWESNCCSTDVRTYLRSQFVVVVVSCIRHTCEYGCPQITVERGLSTHCPRIMRLTAAAEVLINFSVTHSSVELVREDDGREIACGMEACTRWQMMFGKLVNAG